MESIFVPVSLIAGSLLAVQAAANTQLSKATGSPFAATTLQLSVGAGLLAVLAGATGSLSALLALPEATWWHALGGIASAFYVVATILLFPRLGAVVSVGLFIAGQMLASMALDTFGLLGVAREPVGWNACLGIFAVLGGAGAIVYGQDGSRQQIAKGRLPWIALALAAGAVLPIQAAVNALLHGALHAPLAVGLTSFVVAMLSMAVMLAFTTNIGRGARPTLAGLPRMPWWGWLGGIAGAIYVTTMFTAIPAIGAAAATGFTVAGQQIASLLVDRYGWLRLPQRPISGVRLIGVSMLLLGVAVIKFV
jgi:transporter family-2 protein